MPYLSPPNLTRTEVEAILAVTRRHARDHLVVALALGTGLRLGEIVESQAADPTMPIGGGWKSRTSPSPFHLRSDAARPGRPTPDLRHGSCAIRFTSPMPP